MIGEQVLVAVCKLFVCGLIFYMLYIFFRSIFNRRFNNRYFVMVYIMATFIMFHINSYQISWLNLATVPVLLLVLVILTFKISINHAVAYTIIFYVVFSGGKEVAFVLLNRFLQAMIPEYYKVLEGPDGSYILVVEQLLGYFILLFTIRYTKELRISNDNRFSWYLLIIPAASLFVLSSFLYMDFPETRRIQLLMCIGAFLLYFSNIAVFIILTRYTYVLDKIKYAEMYQLKSDLETENFKKLDELNKQNRRFMHDSHTFNSNIRMLAMNGENGKIVEIVDELEGKMHQETTGIVFSGNPVLNAILSERVIKSKGLGVEFEAFIEPYIKVEFIQVSDMVSMFGNLLDNALEAASKCRPDQRRVKVKLFMGSQYMLVLYIENSFLVSAKKAGDRYLTTKEDKQSHGLGIGICQMLAERYGGTLELREESGLFVTILTLAMESNEAI